MFIRPLKQKCCKICAKQYQPKWRSELFCSDECYSESRRISDRKYRASLRLRLWKHKEALGCERCGYNQHGAALDWHHPQADKEQRLTVRNYFTPIGQKERKKCILLCSNCHRVVHANE